MSQLKEITFEEFKKAEDLRKCYFKQQRDKIKPTIDTVNKELEVAFKEEHINNAIPVLIWVESIINTTENSVKYRLESNIEEDFNHKWYDKINPILKQNNIVITRKGNKYM